MIKDNELEVHYHPCKAKVVVDALSHKAPYNYFPTVRLTEVKSSTRVLPDLALYNVTLTPLLWEEIIEAQKDDDEVAHIKRRLQKVIPSLPSMPMEVTSRRSRLPMAGPCTGIPLRQDHFLTTSLGRGV
jgi:hypothetical protein